MLGSLDRFEPGIEILLCLGNAFTRLKNLVNLAT
jgi:hypothetical protein